MKLILVLAVGVFLSVEAYAVKLEGGMIVLSDGDKVVRIETSRKKTKSMSRSELEARVRNLEWAVHYLQNNIYKLNGGWTCEVEAFMKKYYGEGPTKGKAKRLAMEACQKKHNGMHCDLKECTNE